MAKKKVPEKEKPKNKKTKLVFLTQEEIKWVKKRCKEEKPKSSPKEKAAKKLTRMEFYEKYGF